MDTGGRMSTPLRILPTKLFVPRRRQAAVVRSRLVARIEEGAPRPLTLVVAPAGFGKTTLVTHWIDATRMPVAWLSLDAADNDPLRFLSYVLAAVARVRPDVAQFGGVATTTGDVSLAALLDELLVIPLAEETSPFALVLDDFHEITNRTIVAAVDRLLDNLPRCMHVVITSRVEPALSQAVRRAQDAITEIVATDLAFSHDDAAAFFHDAMGLSLDDDAVTTLQRRTEGWVAGMQLAGLALKRGAVADEALRGLTDDGNVAEFLGKEILEVLDPEQRNFLLDTCVLDRLCEPLCEMVTGQPSAGASLRTAIRDGLFLVPLDHNRTWYRYHQLFRDILRRHLRAEGAEREATLHRRAAQWWMSQDDPQCAAAHAAAAGADDVLGAIVDRWGMPALLQSDRPSLERWLAALPERAYDDHPLAWLLVGWLAVLPVRAPPRTGPALAAIASARAALARAPSERRAELEGHLVAIEAIATRPLGDLPGCIAHANAALRTLREGDAAPRTVLALQIGAFQIMIGEPREALEPLEHAEAWGRASGNVFAGIAAMAYRAWALRWLGDLDAAEATCRAAMRLAEQVGVARMGLAGHVHVEQARIHFDRWELASALSTLEEALPRVRLLSDPFLLTTALTLQARVRSAAGEAQLAELSWQEANEEAERVGHPLLRTWVRSCRWNLARTKTDAPMPDLESYQPITHDAAHYGVLAAIDRGEAAHELASRLRERSLPAHAIDWAIACAAALAAIGKDAEAVHALTGAIDRARASRLLRPFVESSARIARLVDQLADRDRQFLGAVAPPAPTVVMAARPPRIGLAPLADPLSPREIEVLALVRRGLNNAEIAQTLFVSVGTIKTHMHRLMAKIGAKNRVEALRLAEDHGLLQG